MTPVTPITLEDDKQRKYAFRPQSDMSPIEAALIAQLFVKLTLNRSGDLPDWPQYCADHNLWRHFAGPFIIVTTPVLDPVPPAPIVEQKGPAELLITIREISTNRAIMIAGDMPVPEGWLKAGVKEPTDG